MLRLISTANTAGLARVVLTGDTGLGIYCFGYATTESPFPEWDYLEDGWDEAKEGCLERWGVPLDSWGEDSDNA